MSDKDIKSILANNPELQQDLFIRAFLICNKEMDNLDDFPFYGNWKVVKHQGFSFMSHKLTGMHFYSEKDRTFFIAGHAYNPFTMEIDEEIILKRIAAACGTDEYIDRINELTGVFVLGLANAGKIEFIVDPSGMQSAACGEIEGTFYLTSHPQLVGDIENLEMQDIVKELVNYKWYGRVMGPYLPADLTPFSELKRVVPNNYYKYDNMITHKRIWPLKGIDKSIPYENAIKESADILKNNMTLIARKWEHPWISLTGGIDSNTTFAAANGNYDKFETFSYISAEKEIPDAEAAKTIAERFNVKHHEINIPESNDDIKLFDEIVEIQAHNSGYIAKRKENESRKRIYLRRNTNCDVEVKSWVSETIRCYWYMHYGRYSMPILSGKLYRNLYKIFITNRKLAHRIDSLFEQFIKEYEFDKIPYCYPPADMHFNDVTWGSWGGLNISEMKYCFDITFAYNNRVFLDKMFHVPIQKRIDDTHHLDMKAYLNKELSDMNIRVVNMKETRFRAWALNVIFTINSILP